MREVLADLRQNRAGAQLFQGEFTTRQYIGVFEGLWAVHGKCLDQDQWSERYESNSVHFRHKLSNDGWFLGDDGPTSQNIYFDVCPGDGGGSCGDCSLSSRACAPRSLVNDNKWHMVTGRWDGTNGQIYVDGVQRDSKALGTLTAPTQQLIVVGGSNQTKIAIDDARVYNRALTAGEVAQLYHLGTANVAHSNAIIPAAQHSISVTRYLNPAGGTL